MTRLISVATGNLTASGTWGAVDATSLSDSEAANTALTASYVTSSTFTPGAITIDGIAVKLASRAAGSPANTISVALDLATVTVTGTEVTLNVADLDACSTTDNEGGWYLFKFAAPVLLVAATVYGVKAKLSATSTAVNLYSTATTNWSRMLRTTTNAAPAAGDTMDVIGEHTGAGTGNSFVVTMNSTATTDYGPGTDGSVGMTIGKRGTLTYGASAATAYYLKLSGDLIVYSGGAINQGTVATKMPSDSSAVLEFDPVADGGMGLIFRAGTGVAQGNPITHRCRIAVDAAANATSFTADASTGWANNDNIVVASTSTTSTQNEKGQVSSTSTTTVNIKSFAGSGGGLLNAHSGTTGSRAEVIKLDRNVIIRSATSTLMTYVFMGPNVSVDWDYVECYYMGANLTNKHGINITTTTGTVTVNDSSFHDFETWGVHLLGATGSGVTIDTCDLYNLSQVAGGSPITVAATTGVPVLNALWCILWASNTFGFNLADTGLTLTNNVAVGGANAGFSFSEAGGTFGTCTDNLSHSCATTGAQILNVTRGTITRLTIYRCPTGLTIGGHQAGRVILDTCTIWGNTASGITGGGGGVPLELRSCAIYGNATAGITATATTGVLRYLLFNCTLGSPNANVSADIILAGTMEVYAWNTIMASTTEVTVGGCDTNFVRSQNHDQNAALHKIWNRNGTIVNDVTIRHTASGYSWKLTPNSATQKLVAPGPSWYDGFRTAILANNLVTITVWLQKDASYNGNQPRLVIQGGILAGVGSVGADVTAAMTGGTGAWEQVTVTATPTEAGVIEYYVDCDGTAGNVYMDDIVPSQA